MMFPNSIHAEVIHSIIADFEVRSDASLRVTEEIAYDFEGVGKHGIYRDIPVAYRTSVGYFKTAVSDVSVEDAFGAPRPFTLSKTGDFLRVKIGDQKKMVSGNELYRISYTVEGPFLYFDDRDELYWNVLGNDWNVPVEKVLATVALPSDAAAIERQCYAGPFGSQGSCDLEQLRTDEKGIHHYEIGKYNLLEGDAVTFAISFPKGIIYEPSQTAQLWKKIKDNGVVFVPFIILFIMLRLWWVRGRDAGKKQTIIAQYKPPEGLTPSEVGTIYDEYVNDKDITATIIDLAVRGYIKIHQLDTKVLFFESHEYVLERLKDDIHELAEFERLLVEALFKSEYTQDVVVNGKTIRGAKLTALKDAFVMDARAIQKSVYRMVVKGKYFLQGPQSIRNVYTSVAIGILVVWFLFSLLFSELASVLSIASAIASVAIVLVIGRYMPAKTKKGRYTLEHIEGFKLFLSVTDTDRLAFHNSPKKTPELFDAYLPYAIALGVERAWAEQFKGIYTHAPHWYSSTHPAAAFSISNFTHDLGAFTTAASAMQAPTSSGSGGRGSSGGGFGGGGGGSW